MDPSQAMAPCVPIIIVTSIRSMMLAVMTVYDFVIRPMRGEKPETCSGCLKSVTNTNASQFLEKNEDHNYQARQNW